MQSETAIGQARRILRHRFGYDEFRPQQAAVIEAVTAGSDCLVLMPTGGGKSICYQIPALMFEGVTVVVSPLIALMKDQVDALRANGIEAAFLNSTQTAAEQVEVFRAARSGQLKLLYVAPERLLQSGDQFLDFLRGINVSLFAIDEAHCISSWGHDFRPEYFKLSRIKSDFPGCPVIALTATADDLVRRDIVEKLSIPNARSFVSSFNRPNIFYGVEPKRNSYLRLLEFLNERRDQSGIIYCLSRNSVDSLAADLRDEGFQALSYHAGLDKEMRDKNQQLFINDDVKIIVATIAFGMGIDKSNVRFVVHMDLPKNIESYYQETGRAGRDGLPSEALLFFSWGDVTKLKGFAAVEGNARQSEIMLRKLDQMARFGDLRTCRRRYLLNYFSEELEEDCGNCDNCTAVVEKFDGTIIAQKALSAVYRTGQRFGIAYLTDLLRGSGGQSVRDEHKNLKTYGVGADVSKEAWFDHFRDLIDQGYLAQTDGRFPVITLTDRSMDVLAGRTKVELAKARVKEERRRQVPAGTSQYEFPLFEELRRIRTEIAKGENLPPYIIFSDATLIEMATWLPQTEVEMRRVMGVGDVKWQKYGSRFLTAVVDYCAARKLTSRTDLKQSSRARKARTRRGHDGRSTFEVSLDMFREGNSVEDIARIRGLSPGTIEGHLAVFIPLGKVRLEEIVSEEKVEPIREAVARLGFEALGPIKTDLGDDFSYGEIRAVIASMQ